MRREPIDYAALFAEAKKSDEFWIETAKAEFTEEIARLLLERKMTRSRLAKALGVSPANISKILRGANNFKIETMVRLARALQTTVKLHLAPEGWQTRWFDLPRSVASDSDNVSFTWPLQYTLSAQEEKSSPSRYENLEEAAGASLTIAA